MAERSPFLGGFGHVRRVEIKIDGLNAAFVELYGTHDDGLGEFHGYALAADARITIELPAIPLGMQTELSMWPARWPLDRLLWPRRNRVRFTPEWDARFVVVCENAEPARKFLTPDRRGAIADATTPTVPWRLDDRVLTHRLSTYRDKAELQPLLHRLAGVARAITA